MTTWNGLIEEAFNDIGSYDVGDTILTAHQTLAQTKLNRIIKGWQGRRMYAYNHGDAQYAVTASHSPHKIGPGQSSPDWDADRPSEVEHAEYISGSSYFPIDVIDEQDWRDIVLKEQTGDRPFKLYPKYCQSYVELYFWPIPAASFNVRLWTWDCIPQVDGTVIQWTDTIAIPPNYEEALLLTLEEKLCKPMSRPIPAELPGQAAGSRYAITKRNIKSPKIRPRGFRRGGRDFNYLTGM